MAVYRVFLIRDYRAVAFYDVRAPTQARAAAMAKRHARRQLKDVRADATDSGWQATRPIIEVESPGACGERQAPIVEEAPGIWRFTSGTDARASD